MFNEFNIDIISILSSQEEKSLLYHLPKGDIMKLDETHFNLFFLQEGQLKIMQDGNEKTILNNKEMMLLPTPSQSEIEVHGLESSSFVLMDYDGSENYNLNYDQKVKIIESYPNPGCFSFPIPMVIQKMLKYLVYYTDNEQTLNTAKMITPVMLRSLVCKEELSKLLYPVSFVQSITEKT